MPTPAARQQGNLPAERNVLVGRSAEVAELRGILPSARLITLVGPGGVGKTRLGLELARRSRNAFSGGTWFVPLAELTQPELIVPTISGLLTGGARARTPADAAELIGDRQMLILLDNCEHLIDACAELVDDLLPRCPDLKVVATSREALRITGETLFPVMPLRVPVEGAPLKPGGFSEFDAIALFIARASALDPNFDSSKHEAEIVEICQRLDGLPLAIELAAAASHVLPMDALVARVDSSTPYTRRRGIPSRHQDLRSTIRYSFDLCSPAARLLWAHMSVFRGGASLDAIEAICTDDDLTQEDIWAALGELVDKSVLIFERSRYRMLSTIRTFGYELLVESGAAPRLRTSHRDHYAALAAQFDAEWFGHGQAALLERLGKDHSNLRAALEYCLTETGAAGTGLKMAVDLYPYWLGAGLPAEGRHWLDRLLKAPGATEDERMPGLWVGAFLTAIGGDIEAARMMLDRCLELASQRNDTATIGRARQSRGIVELLAGKVDSAVEELRAAVEVERSIGEMNPFLVPALVDLGSALCFARRIPEAEGALQEARELSSRRGEQLFHSWTTVLLGLAAFFDDRIDEAAAFAREALISKRALHDALGIEWAVEILAWSAFRAGRPERAARLLSGNAVVSEPLGHHLSSLPQLVELHDEHVALTRAELGNDAYDAIVRGTVQLSRQQIFAYALGESDEAADPTGASPATNLDELPLTPREREIALLVAEGLTNKAIATRLVIGHRTVDTHVEHIRTKMGFTSRTQIAALFGAKTGDSQR